MIILGQQRAYLLIEIGVFGGLIAFAREHQRDARFVCGAQGQMRAFIRGEPAKEQRIIAFVRAEWPLVDAQRVVHSPNPIQVRRQLALPVADGDQADLVAKCAVVRVQIVVDRTVHSDHRGYRDGAVGGCVERAGERVVVDDVDAVGFRDPLDDTTHLQRVHDLRIRLAEPVCKNVLPQRD